MSSNTGRPAAGASEKTATLIHLLIQNEQVHDKVERAAVELSAVNAVLKDEAGDAHPFAKIERALHQSEAIEVKVQEAAAELLVVNDDLALEIDARLHLEH